MALAMNALRERRAAETAAVRGFKTRAIVAARSNFFTPSELRRRKGPEAATRSNQEILRRLRGSG
jgi:hypothetical protein